MGKGMTLLLTAGGLGYCPEFIPTRPIMRGLPRIPDLLTTANLVCGTASILLASQGQLTVGQGSLRCPESVGRQALGAILDGEPNGTAWTAAWWTDLREAGIRSVWPSLARDDFRNGRSGPQPWHLSGIHSGGWRGSTSTTGNSPGFGNAHSGQRADLDLSGTRITRGRSAWWTRDPPTAVGLRGNGELALCVAGRVRWHGAHALLHPSPP